MSDTRSILVSVVIPCFNSSAFLRETVDSVLAQSLGDLEIVLVDDGSTDDTRGCIDELIASHPQRALTSVFGPNVGVAGARNRGIAHAHGRYILPVDADDLITPAMAAACAEVLDRQPDTAIVFTDREDFGALEGTFASGRFELARLKYFNQLPYASMFRRQVWEAVGGYRANVSGFDDWDFWIAAAAGGFRAQHLPYPHLRHRRRQRSQLCHVMIRYESLFATIILNNQAVYAPDEIAAARSFLATGEPAALLASSKLIFASRYALPSAAAPEDPRGAGSAIGGV
jgi:glycosyltransferase involved in cell wall biosynthesis